MSWTEVCKVNFNNAVMGITEFRGKSITETINQLSDESGIPKRTLWRWWSEHKKETREFREEIGAAIEAQKEAREAIEGTAKNGSRSPKQKKPKRRRENGGDSFKEPQRPRLDDVVRAAVKTLRSFESQILRITSGAQTDAILPLVRPALKAEFVGTWDRVVPKMGEILTAHYEPNMKKVEGLRKPAALLDSPGKGERAHVNGRG